MGLVLIPVGMYKATVDNDIHFNQLDKESKESLMERKQILSQLVQEDSQIAVSRYVETKGRALYHAADEKELEGVVAKRKESIYLMGRRTKDWVKFGDICVGCVLVLFLFLVLPCSFPFFNCVFFQAEITVTAREVFICLRQSHPARRVVFRDVISSRCDYF